MASAPAPDGSAGLSVILSNSIVGTKDSLLGEMELVQSDSPCACTWFPPTEKEDINYSVAF